MATRTPAGTTPLMLTGERTLPGIPDENYWFRRHEAAYLAVLPFVTGSLVLEAGSGEGYGARLLTTRASAVVALDNDAASTLHSRRTYPGLALARGDLQRLPVADASFEVLACLQVIEHLWDQPGFVRECARVLRPAGTLLVTTPNRLTFSPDALPGDRPLNPFHTRELSPAELVELLAPEFVVTRLLGLRHGRRLRRFEHRHGPLVATLVSGAAQSWPARTRSFVHGVRATDFAVTADDADSSLDLVVVARTRTTADP